MSQLLNISHEDILYQVKISCQIPSFVEAIAARKIIADAAAKEGIQVEIKELQQAADNIRLTNNLLKAEDTWTWLNKHHLDLDNLEEIVKINLLSNKLAIHLFAGQVEPFFYQNELNFTRAVTYEVILDDQDVAFELFYALQEGEISFQEIARQYIENPEIRRAGGYQGVRRRQDFRPEIAAAVFASQPPQVIKPIVTAKGVHLIWVEEIIQPKLDEQLRAKIMGDLFETWLKQQVAKLDIVTQVKNDNASDVLNGEVGVGSRQ